MKVLLINKFYYPSGGAERYVFDWEQALRDRGHEVAVFSMQHPRNAPSAQAPWFVSRVDFSEAHGPTARLRTGLRSIYSFEARRRLRGLLREVRPDIAHVHSYCYQLTPSIFAPLRQAGVPVVQTAHEYYHACANQRLYDGRRFQICERCPREHWAPVRARCVKGSLSASLAAWTAKALDDRLGLSRRGIDLLVAPSAFMRAKTIEAGWPEDRVAHVPNFVDVNAIRPADGPGRYVVFVGRLVRHKGPLALLRAAEQLRDVPVKIVGEGPMMSELRAFVAERGLSHVDLAGFREGEDLRRLVAESRAVVAPSEWYENASLVVLEAMAAARAVMASDIGGVGEQVRHEQEGLLFPAGDLGGLVAGVRRLWDNPREAVALGRRGRDRVEAMFSADVHYRRMMALFRGLLA